MANDQDDFIAVPGAGEGELEADDAALIVDDVTWVHSKTTFIDHFSLCVERLRLYREHHGHYIVPRKHPGLGAFRAYYRRQDGCTFLGDDKRKKLREVGFGLTDKPERNFVEKKPNMKASDKRNLDRFIERLRLYRLEHGDCNVPTENKKLRWFVVRQRRLHEDNELPLAHKERLEVVGITFAEE